MPAGDPLNGGGFVILNGVGFDHHANLAPLPSPYPGSNLFSLASGAGPIYARDPHRVLIEEQLNGGVFATLTRADWDLIEPYLTGEREALRDQGPGPAHRGRGAESGPTRSTSRSAPRGMSSLGSAGLDEWVEP